MLLHSDRQVTPWWAKSDPPLRGCVRSPAGFVTALAGATSPCCALFLSSGPPDAIRLIRDSREVL